MNLRNMLLLTGLAVFLAACTNTSHSNYRYYDQRYDDSYYDYRSTPSYQGYYYERIIFIRNVPYYVDDDRYIRQIPPRMYDHFRRYPYDTLGRPPMFSPDTEVRDGYPVSRIIYLDGVPYHVGNDRIAQPLPERLRQHFRYTPGDQGNAPANGNRPQPPAQQPAQHDNGWNNEPPVLIRDQDREHLEQSPFERGQHEGAGGSNAADPKGRTTPFPDQSKLPPNAGEWHAGTPNGKELDLTGNPSQATDDTGKKKTGKKKTDKKKSRHGKKDKQSDSTKADHDSGNKKEPRNDN